MLWLEGIGTTCPRFFPLSSPGVLAWDSRPLTATSSSKTDFPYPYFRCLKGGYIRFRLLANHFAFILPFPGHWMQTSVGFHSDPHSLLSPTGRSKLTYITILFFLPVSLWRLLIQTRSDSRNSLFLSSQWKTTWHFAHLIDNKHSYHYYFIIISFLLSFSYQCYLIVFHLSLNDRKTT